MTGPELADALRGFVERIGPLYPADPAPDVEVRVGHAVVQVPDAVATVLAEALRAYHDSRDHGRCGRCGGPMDERFLCTECGQPGGLFGDLVRERYERSPGP